MSKTQYRPPGSGKNVKKRVVTIMLSFLFLDEIICEHNFSTFIILFVKDLGVFYIRNIYKWILTKKRQKTPENSRAKIVSSYAVRKVNGIDI